MKLFEIFKIMDCSAEISKVCQSEDRPQLVCSEGFSHAYKLFHLTMSKEQVDEYNSIDLKKGIVIGKGKKSTSFLFFTVKAELIPWICFQ